MSACGTHDAGLPAHGRGWCGQNQRDEESHMAFVRKCEKCGSLDTRESWASPTEAADKGAFQNWTCRSCAWTEFDLVEASETGEEAQKTR
jgi:predicted nucleic-acid-binding Zn-ribbon protein